MNYTFYKLRGGGTVSLAGFSDSISYAETNSYSDSESLTFSVAKLGTSSTALYTDPSALTVGFSGTPSTTTNLKMSLQGVQLSSVTASGAVLSTYIASLANSFVFSGVNTGFTASYNSSSISIIAPTNTGNYYNGATLSSVAVLGAGGSTFTYSVASKTFSNGSTTYSVVLNYSKLGANDGYSLVV
jgi:hypothetical protein